MYKFVTQLVFFSMLVHIVHAQVANTPPSNSANHVVDVSENGPGLNRNGRIARYPDWVYPAGEDVLAPWRVDRGFVLPSQHTGLLSNPYHATGLSMNQSAGVPDNYTGHVPVYSEGNYWPYVGASQVLPNNQGTDRDLVQDAGLYFVGGEVVATVEPLFVQGDNRLIAKNETNYSFIITAGSFPGTEQPGQVMNILDPGETIIVPVAPEGWWPDSVVPETYSSVAGLNPLHIPGWHHSSWSPSEYPGGSQPRDFGTPGFAYNLDPNIDYREGMTNNYLFAGLRSAEGYDPLISGDPGYGIAFYVDNALKGVIDMVKTDDYNALATLVAHKDGNPANRQQGPIHVASAIIAVAPSQNGEYRYISHEDAQALISEYRNRPNWIVITQAYDSNPQAMPQATEVDPVLPGNSVPSDSPSSSPSPAPVSDTEDSPRTKTDAQYDPGQGKTIVLVGQNVWGEYEDYANLFSAPAGSSHYGSLYSSANVRAGVGSDTDSNAQFFLNNVNSNYPRSFSLIAMDIKGNPGERSFNSVAAALNGVVNGWLDDEIDGYANMMLSQPERKFILRIGYEVSTSVFGSGSAYANAFNYIANRIRNIKQVKNVDFLYHPDYLPAHVKALYPGDQYVDFIGFSVFNSAVCMPVASQTFCSNGDRINPALIESMEWVEKTSKAFMIPESSPRVPAVNSAEGYNEYLTRLFEFIERYDVRVLSFISTDWPGQLWPTNEWGDSRLGRFVEVENKWRELINGERFIHYDDLLSDASSPSAGPTPLPISSAPPAASDPPTAPPTETPSSLRKPAATTRIDAENGEVLNGAQVYADGNASGGSYVAFIMTNGRGVKFYDVPQADSLTIGYASQESGSLGILVNGVLQATASFTSNGAWSGRWAETNVEVDVPSGANVEVLYNVGSVNIDYVDFVFRGDPSDSSTPLPLSTPAPTPSVVGGGATPNPDATPMPTAGAGTKPRIPSDGERYFILGQDRLSIEEYMNQSGLPKPNGFTMYVTLARGERSYDDEYCFKGLDGLKDLDNYESHSAQGCWPGDNQRLNEWGSGVQNVQWAIETYAPETMSIGLWCPSNDRMASLYNNGAYDDLLTELADFFKYHADTAFFLRTCYEFNGDAGGWSDVNFRETFKYVRTFLDKQNVKNVAHVWQSDAYHATGRAITAIGDQEEGYWPGKRYVDWVGSSQFHSDVGEEALIAEAEGLPHFIAESTPHGELFHQYDFKLPFNGVGTSPDGSVTLHNDVNWFNDKQNEITRVSTKAWHYINADWSAQPQWANAADQAGQNYFKYTDSRIQESTRIQDYFNDLVTKENGFILENPAGAAPVPTPTVEPTSTPTTEPKPTPTTEPTPTPAAEPAPTPTAEPTPTPTAEPTPTPTAEPTPAPTAEPTPTPTAEPTLAPTAEPTLKPTAMPTAEPMSAPTAEPTAEPTSNPTSEPAPTPTSTAVPIVTPSPVPSVSNRYFIQHKPTSRRIYSCKRARGAAVGLADESEASSCAQWEMITRGNYFHLSNRHSGRYIRPANGGDGARIELQRAWNGKWTQWSYEDRGDDHGHIYNRATGSLIYSGSDGILSQQPSSWRSDFSRWRFVAVPLPLEPEQTSFSQGE